MRMNILPCLLMMLIEFGIAKTISLTKEETIDFEEDQIILHGTPKNLNLAKNQTLRVVGSGARPYLIDLDGPKPKGVDLEIINILASKLGFEYEFTPTSRWGTEETGTAGQV